jgi:hypothetical protein
MADTVTSSVTYDGLLVDDFPYHTDTGTILTGQDLSRGTLLGKITSGGKLQACDHTASDGSETPYAVLAADIDTTGGDATGLFIDFGCFDPAKMTFGGSTAIADVKDAMKSANLYTKTVLTQI